MDAPPFLQMAPGSKIPMQSVPTSVAGGKLGEYYVGELSGFPFPTGAARVYLGNGVNDARNGAPQVFAVGFTNIIDLSAGKDGSLYVLEIAKDGLLAAGESAPTGKLIGMNPTASAPC